MKSKRVVLAIVSIVLSVVSLLAFVACDDKDDNSNNGGGMVFENETTLESVAGMIKDGTIKNCTIDVESIENEGTRTTTTYYIADGEYYWYYTYYSNNALLFAGYSIDEDFAYSIGFQPEDEICNIEKFDNKSDYYQHLKEVLCFNSEYGSSLISYLLSSDENTIVKDFTVAGNKIAWTREVHRRRPSYDEYVEMNITLYNVNSTEECEFPKEVENYKEIAKLREDV